MQGGVSAVASIMKKDIYAAFLEFVTCGRAGSELPNPSGSFRISFQRKEEGVQERDDESNTDERKELGGVHAETSATSTTEEDGDAHIEVSSGQ